MGKNRMERNVEDRSSSFWPKITPDIWPEFFTRNTLNPTLKCNHACEPRGPIKSMIQMGSAISKYSYFQRRRSKQDPLTFCVYSKHCTCTYILYQCYTVIRRQMQYSFTSTPFPKLPTIFQTIGLVQQGSQMGWVAKLTKVFGFKCRLLTSLCSKTLDHVWGHQDQSPGRQEEKCELPLCYAVLTKLCHLQMSHIKDDQVVWRRFVGFAQEAIKPALWKGE